MAEQAPHALHFSTVHSADDTRIFAKQCSSLAAAGYRVTLMTLGGNVESSSASGVVRRTLPSAPGRLARMTIGQWRMLRSVFTTPADIYHFHDPELMPTGLILRLAGRRVVFDSHEHIARDLGEKVWLPPIGRRLARLLGRGIERVADRWMSAVVITTPGMRDAYPSADTVLLRNLPKLEEFSDPPEWDTRSSAVSYIGLVCDFRGSRQIARLAERTSARVIVAGPLADAERAKLQDERGWKRVDYRGTVGRDGVVDILGQSRVGLAILLPMRNFEDSIPTKVLEYLAAGIPVVASDFASWRDLVEGAECVDFVDPTDDDQIAHAVNALLDDPGRAQAMGRAGREMVLSRYVWEREVESLFGLYARLLAPRSDPVAIQPAQTQNAQS